MPPDAPAPPPPPDDPLLIAEVEEVEAAQVLVVRVGEERLAVPLADLSEVLRARPAARIPGAPAWVTGLVAVRGVPVPVADLVRRADRTVTTDAPWLVIVEQGGRQAAFAVSAADGVHVVVATDDACASEVGALPRRGSVRLQSQAAGRALGAPDAADVLDVAALLDELFDGD